MFAELILQDATHVEQPASVVEEEDREDSEGEGLFAVYHNKRRKKGVETSPSLQLSHYLDIREGQQALSFWAAHKKGLPTLFRLATRV